MAKNKSKKTKKQQPRQLTLAEWQLQKAQVVAVEQYNRHMKEQKRIANEQRNRRAIAQRNVEANMAGRCILNQMVVVGSIVSAVAGYVMLVG